jgi:hypothetical protein
MGEHYYTPLWRKQVWGSTSGVEPYHNTKYTFKPRNSTFPIKDN